MRFRLLLVAVAALFSTGGAMIKLSTLTPLQVASFRSAVAAAVLFVALPESRRRLPPHAWLTVAAYAATLVLFVVATRLTTAANAIFLQSTAPCYVLLLGPPLLGERIERRDLAYLAAVAAGMVCLFLSADRASATAPDPHRGNLLGLASGVAWALTLIGLRAVGRIDAQGGSTTLATVVAGNFLASIVVLPAALPVEQLTLGNALIILYLGAVQIGLAYVCLARAIRHVPAFEATTVLLVEPVMNPVWTWWVHGERPSPAAMAGGAIILAATMGNAWWNRR
jgi:drug/metabolite transporter, DME family